MWSILAQQGKKILQKLPVEGAFVHLQSSSSDKTKEKQLQAVFKSPF